MKTGPAIHPGNRQLRSPHDRRQRGPRLRESGRAEQVWHDRHERQPGQRGEKERDLVDVLDDDVERALAQRVPHRPAPTQREAVPPRHTRHVDPVHAGLRRAARPTAGNQLNLMTPPGDPAEQLVQMDFGATGLRVFAVVPVDEQDPHSAPVSRATASSTPLMNAGARAPANQ